MKRLTIIFLLATQSLAFAQQDSKKRLDFARTYFELGGNFFPSFDGVGLVNNNSTKFKNSASFNPYLNWGGFHFWEHMEFYVTFPLDQFKFSKEEQTDFLFNHYVVTGARYLPWAYKPQKIRPYVGASWSALEFRQSVGEKDQFPRLTKDLLLVPDIGVLYGFGNVTARLGLNYYPINRWDYPISNSVFEKIETPKLGLMVGLIYSFESSKNEDSKTVKKWNEYPKNSRIGYQSKNYGDFFIGIGPSSSFSLKTSKYNQVELPYLQDKLTSNNFFDIAIGYQFNQLESFIAISYRIPVFKASGFGTEQKIRKDALSIEWNKYIVDFHGFAPYVGFNLSYDQLNYSESINGNTIHTVKKQNFEPGLVVGWDIIPGKTDEFLILRTNLKWYPNSSFQVNDSKFKFSQLEYNLIQAVFYPGRFIRSKG